ncbi:NADPH-dependent FMN reductase [Mammaliicoccus sp. Dog046]|uniref:NADPH-dependent FMN reductase n=1 Tax=Mammaliicoccus sp. Dog046 TaxID=3034233 RepID=UPI002B25B35B|nr:NADPH-dependent FMN reductase [Mammaliicoccus sp. Dog046]WQK85280.1 NADPH-dependent FMN reductase [Mammaliicoccus sp. Dog046]
MKVLLIVGSAKQYSHTHALAQFVRGTLEEQGAEVTLFDLYDKPIPYLDVSGQHLNDERIKNNVNELKAYAEEADAIIIGTPNYHGSYSGILKNALDHLTMDQFKMKPVGLICNSGGMRSTEPLSHLRIIMRNLLAIAVPVQISTQDADFAKTEQGTYYIDVDDIKLRAKLFSEQIVKLMQNNPWIETEEVNQ